MYWIDGADDENGDGIHESRMVRNSNSRDCVKGGGFILLFRSGRGRGLDCIYMIQLPFRPIFLSNTPQQRRIVKISVLT